MQTGVHHAVSLSPLVEEIAKEYAWKIIVYKVDTEKEKILSQKSGNIRFTNSSFYSGTGKSPDVDGCIPKESLIKAINEVLLIK